MEPDKQHLTIREFELHGKYMKDTLIEIKTNLNQSFDKINNKLDKLPDKFVTKEEFGPVHQDVDDIKGTLKNVVAYIVTSLITGIIGLGAYLGHVIFK